MIYNDWIIDGEGEHSGVRAKSRDEFRQWCDNAGVNELLMSSIGKVEFAMAHNVEPFWYASCALCQRFFPRDCIGCPVWLQDGERPMCSKASDLWDEQGKEGLEYYIHELLSITDPTTGYPHGFDMGSREWSTWQLIS